MNNQQTVVEYKAGRKLLFDSSFTAIPFNIVMAALLSFYLFFNQIPAHLIVIWFIAVCILSCARMIHCKLVLNDYFYNSEKLQLKIFLALTFISAITWPTIYFVSLRYVSELQLYVIILVLGGMCAGAATSLSVYTPAFFTYILTIFLPVVVYDYFKLDMIHAIMATMFVCYLLAISVIARSYQRILKQIFFLREQNEDLIIKLEKLSITDSLTGLYNRRHFTQVIQDEFNRAKRNQQSFALIAMDIDHLKSLNDNFGHPFGDKFLRYTASYLKKYLRRSNDIIFRIGGDEFAILLLNSTEDNLKKVCDDLRNNFKLDPKFDYGKEDAAHQKVLQKVSFSAGVVYVSHDSNLNTEQIVNAADQLLYHAKNEGKNIIKYSEL